MNKLKEIFGHVLNDLEKIFPYFVIFYILILLFCKYYLDFKKNINLPILHVVFIVFLITFLIKKYQEKSKIDLYIQKVRAFFFNLGIRGMVKLSLVMLVIVLCLYFNISFLSLAILVFGLLSFLFVWDSRIAAGIALAFLVVCVVSLLFKKENFAEHLAIISYYFLIITAVTSFRELSNNDNVDK